jgi:hypothetical protein
MHPIPVIARAEWNEEFAKQSQPCLIADGLQDWPAFEKWSPDYLKAAAGERQVTVQVSHSGKWRFKPDGSPVEASAQYGIPQVRLHQATDWVVSRPQGYHYYVSETDLRQFPELLADLRFPGPAAAVVNLWFGSNATVTPLHFDRMHNFFAQITGRKTATLIDPADTRHVHVAADAAFYHLSPVDVEEPDLAAHPQFRHVQPRTIAVEPGQMLFIPAFWWHHVRSHDVSISVNKWWKPALEDCTGDSALLQAIRAYRHDGMCQLRTMEGLTAHQLVRVAELMARSRPAAGVIPMAVALDDIVRRPPPHASTRPPIDESTRRRVQQLLDLVVSGRPEDVRRVDFDEALAAVRGLADLVAVL